MGEKDLKKEIDAKQADIDKKETEFKEFVEGLQQSFTDTMERRAPRLPKSRRVVFP